MKITKNQLRKIIKEEVRNVLSETKMMGGMNREMGIGRGSEPQDTRSTADSSKLFNLKQQLFDKLEAAIEEEDEDHWLKDMPADGEAPGYDDLESDLMVSGDYTIEDYLKAIKAFLTKYGEEQFLEALR